jgi:polysaccharide deacetylase 2 family uncharacterized protein YibQ
MIKIQYYISIKLAIIGFLTVTVSIYQPLKFSKNIENQSYSSWLAPLVFNTVFAQQVNNKVLVHKNAKPKLVIRDLGSALKLEYIQQHLEPLAKQTFDPSVIVSNDEPLKQKKFKSLLKEPGFKSIWRKNAFQLTELPPGPKISIVIDDAGLDQKRTAAVIGLTGPLTISFLTYGKDLTEQVRAAKTAGHEIMVHMAMEPLNKSIDPGPNALLTDSSERIILQRLRWGLERFNGYVGINNHMGSLFTSNPMGMEVVMRELKRRGLLFLDSRTSEKTVAASIALIHKVPFTQRNIFLDNVASVPAINKQLRLMELIAKKNGYVVAIAHPRDATIQALSQWLPIMAERGFVQVPISTIVAERHGLSPINLGRTD